MGMPAIKGKYEGKSKEINDDNTEKIHIEEIFIKQSLLSTSLSAVSKLENGTFFSKWKGTLIDYSDEHFKFAIQIDARDGIYHGILSLRFEDNQGFGYCSYLEPEKINKKDSLEIKLIN